MRAWIVAAVAVLSVAPGCASRTYFRADAFYGRSDVVTLDYADAASRALLDGWTVDNFRRASHPWPETPKQSPEYRYELVLDWNEDGRLDLRETRDL